MNRTKLFRRLISFALALSVSITAFIYGTDSAKAVGIDDIKNESRMELGYSIINGYSKLSVRKGLNTYSRSAVYSGLSVNNPYIIALVGTFYLTNRIDFDRAMVDNDYAMQLIGNLNGFLGKMGVKNDRGNSLKADLIKNHIDILESFDTVGMYIINTDKTMAEEFMQDGRVDFVFAGGAVPPTMKDLNMDGKSDALDAPLIQQYLAGSLVFDDTDENEYIKFAGDINGDKEFDINDAGELM